MAFVTKEWKDRLVEFAGRRKLKNVSTGAETTYDVARAEGNVSQTGDAFSAANLNDLEQRIKTEFGTVNDSLNAGNLDFDYIANDGLYYEVKVGADTVRKKCESTVVNLGSAASYDLTKYIGYKDFIVNKNLFLVALSVSTQSGSHWGGYTSASLASGISYNQTTGIASVYGTVINHVSTQWSETSSSGSFTYNVFLVY